MHITSFEKKNVRVWKIRPNVDTWQNCRNKIWTVWTAIMTRNEESLRGLGVVCTVYGTAGGHNTVYTG